MNIDEAFEYYKLIKYNVQLDDVDLFDIECRQNEKFHDGEVPLRVTTGYRSKQLDQDTIEIFLRVTLDFEEKGPFYLKVTYRGVCSKRNELDEDSFKQQAESQTVPLLLPYVRECMSNTIIRMGYSPYILPTMDILNSLAVNSNQQSEE